MIENRGECLLARTTLRPELASLKSAARAAIVMPAVFAFADKVIGDTQTATFAAFGSFAMLISSSSPAGPVSGSLPT